VTQIRRGDNGAVAVVAETQAGRMVYPVGHVISSMPLSALVQAMDPPPPPAVLAAANGLSYRDFLSVALVIPTRRAFPDNWIYVHSPEVRLGRIQNFGAWSPFMVKDGRACLGLEYFAFEGDDLWTMADEDLVELGRRELATLGLVDASEVEAGYVVRMPKAYPMYDEGYKANVDILRGWLQANVGNVHPVGRNGMHRYNNQDHSMLTSILTVENILGASHDIWAVNVEGEYHEEKAAPGAAQPSTGRDAPVLPRRVIDGFPATSAVRLDASLSASPITGSEQVIDLRSPEGDLLSEDPV
jgi:protoporphyrinogen oxidase